MRNDLASLQQAHFSEKEDYENDLLNLNKQISGQERLIQSETEQLVKMQEKVGLLSTERETAREKIEYLLKRQDQHEMDRTASAIEIRRLEQLLKRERQEKGQLLDAIQELSRDL